MAGTGFRRFFSEVARDYGEGRIFEQVEDGDTILSIMECLNEHAEEMYPGRMAALGKTGFSRPLFYMWIRAGRNQYPDRVTPRMTRYAEARQRSAESHVDRMLVAVETATVADIGVKREQARVHQWVAGKLDRARFGEQPAQVTVNLGSMHLEALRVRVMPVEGGLPALPASADYETVEGQPEEGA